MFQLTAVHVLAVESGGGRLQTCHATSLPPHHSHYSLQCYHSQRLGKTSGRAQLPGAGAAKPGSFSPFLRLLCTSGRQMGRRILPDEVCEAGNSYVVVQHFRKTVKVRSDNVRKLTC